MVLPEACEDCESDRLRRATRGRLLARNTKNLSWFTEPPSADEMTAYKKHKADMYDQVELWPRKPPASKMATTTTTDASNVLGADIRTDAINLNAAPMDGSKVCGFHMHALEWHHMQTLSVDQILMFAKNTQCDVFHLSLIRWLGDLANLTTIRNCDIDTNFHLGLKLFHKLGCFCKKEAALAKGPRISTWATSSTRPSSLFFPSHSTTHYSSISDTNPNKNREYLIMCAGRVYSNHSAYEMVPQPGEETYYNYNIRSWVKKSGGFLHCGFQLPLQKAIFARTLVPHHPRIYSNDWLSQWLKPTPFAPQTRPDSSSPSGLYWLQRARELLMTVKDPSSTTTTYVANRVTLQSPLIPMTPQPQFPSSSTPRSFATACDVGQDELIQPTRLLTGEGQAREQDQFDSTTEFYELDKELQEALSRHAETVKSIKEKVPTVPSQAQEQERYIKEINMDAFTSITMLLCDNCRDNKTRNFCVIPRVCQIFPSQQPSQGQGIATAITTSSVSRTTPRSIDLFTPIGSNDEITFRTSEVSDFFDFLDPLSGLLTLDAELDQADRVLERALTRHAHKFERTMEIRSRLVPDFLLCRACRFREINMDILPCEHHILCTACIERIEFYLVPYVMEGGV
ncbi:hypothetical protein EC991_008639 [Linnemannia zychae]|nr:hypothetical protein EC991_008639 [Linnemannia zychae]